MLDSILAYIHDIATLYFVILFLFVIHLYFAQKLKLLVICSFCASAFLLIISILVLQKIGEPNFINLFLKKIVENVNNLSIYFLSIAFVLILLFFVVQKRKFDFSILFLGSISTSAIPMGLALIGCALDNTLLPKMTGTTVGIYLALAGLSLIFISFREIFQQFKKEE